MSNLKYEVSSILEHQPSTRDNDDILISRVLINHPDLKPKEYATVTRLRRELQQFIPNLRWEKYNERQKHSRVKQEEYSRKSRNQEKPIDVIWTDLNQDLKEINEYMQKNKLQARPFWKRALSLILYVD